ncbi:MAG TPA: phosphatase PAP2 family protein [Bacilli bacterium]|nr:phosphatase PAP2 family protein [Bacilli bacterium]
MRKRVSGWMRQGDISAFFLVNHGCKSSWADRLMPWVTHLGGAVWCVILSLACLLQRDLRDVGIDLALSLICSTLIVTLCKKLLPRRRPYLKLLKVRTVGALWKDASFPSGHSAAAFAKATVLAAFLPGWGTLLYLLATVVALSRVYLGQHYPSDIVAGAGLGITTASLLI